nr:hypothetical protein [Tanacetum cinerariifolium]
DKGFVVGRIQEVGGHKQRRLRAWVELLLRMYRAAAVSNYTTNAKRRPSAKTGGVWRCADFVVRVYAVALADYKVRATLPHRVVHGLHVLVFFELIDELFDLFGLLIVERNRGVGHALQGGAHYV